MADTEAEAYVAYLAGEFQYTAAGLEDEIYRQIASAMTGLPDAAQLAEARAIAAEKVKRITGELADAEFNKVADAILHGVARGDHPFKTARRLDAIKGLDRGRAASLLKYEEYLETLNLSDAEIAKRLESRFQKLLRERKKVIAQNQMREVSEEGHRIQAEADGAQFKVWYTTGDAKVSDGCRANEAAGVIPMNKDFPAPGGSQPPRHPRCRCSVSYVQNEAQKARADTISERLVARTDTAKAEAG